MCILLSILLKQWLTKPNVTNITLKCYCFYEKYDFLKFHALPA